MGEPVRIVDLAECWTGLVLPGTALLRAGLVGAGVVGAADRGVCCLSGHGGTGRAGCGR